MNRRWVRPPPKQLPNCHKVIIAPDANDAARNIFAAKKNLRLLITTGLAERRRRFDAHGGGGVSGTKQRCRRGLRRTFETVTERAGCLEMADLLFAWQVAKHVKSNAIVYAKDGATVGIGAGQMSRLDSSRIAARKSEDAAEAAGLSAGSRLGGCVRCVFPVRRRAVECRQCRCRPLFNWLGRSEMTRSSRRQTKRGWQ